MDTRDTRISDSRPSTADSRSWTVPPSGTYDPVGLGPAAWGLNDQMSAALARNWWAIALRGVFAILWGIIALVLPGATIAALVLLFAAYMLVDGIFAIVAAVKAARHHERWGWLVVEGIADFIAGAIALLWPLVTVLAFVYLMGAWGVISGAMLTTAAFRLNPPHGRGWMIFGGIVSIIWGALLFIWPITGALVLTWWTAGYALLFGGALIALAFQLRARRNEQPASGPASQGA
jgi:uncharacterized membrane protein HdeD (DUF308 family)